METSRKRIRRDFAPLTVSVAIACDAAYSPLMQVYNAASGEYEPNRQLSPTVIKPVINASAADGSWPEPSANAALANMKWFVNGVDITTISAWAGKYSIDQVGSTRGSITILNNILPGSNVSLHFEAILVDHRLGVNIPIKTDSMVLTTIDKADDAFALSIGDGQSIRYNPFLDKLLLYDYKVAHGIIAASSSARNAALDGNEYERTIPIHFFKGDVEQTSGYTVKLYRISSSNTYTEIGASDYEIRSITPTAIAIDMRLITKGDYMIKAFIGSEEKAKCQFSVLLLHPSFHCSPCNETGILPNQIERYDVALVSSEERNIEYPGNVLKIIWKTDTLTKTDMEHNEGGTTIFDLRQTGIGNDYTNDWIDVYTQAVQKDAYCVATDNGDILTDENGNILIFN